MILRWLQSGTVGFGILLILALTGCVFWAKTCDPFQRIWFKLKIENGNTDGVAVMPKPSGPRPVAVFMHGYGNSLLSSGAVLRRFAETGFNVVTIEYNQTNSEIADQQIFALDHFLPQQNWASGQPVVWIGSSLGVQRILSFALRNKNLRSDLIVSLSGGLVPELDPLEARSQNAHGQGNHVPIKCPVLLVCEKENTISMKDAKVLQKLLRARRMSVDLRVSRNGEHGFGLESGEVPRAIGEYCCAFLASNKPLIFSPGQFSEAKPFVVCITPSIFWAVGWSMLRRRTLKNSFQTIRLNKDIEMGSPETPGPRWVNRFTIAISAILCIWALGESAVHLITPQFDICESTLAIARRSLIPRRLKLDFESMASQSFWFGRRLQTMLTHLELSDYNRTLINWEVDKRIYLGFVLSPVIDSKHDPEMNWRRALWEFFYPRISKQYTADSVAEIVVRELRARVSIDQRFEYPIGIETVWRNQVTSAKGFERIYVAALRSVGVGARLDVAGQTEIWTAGEWRKAPRPSVESWLDETMLKRSGMTNSIGPTRAKNTDRVCEASTGPPLMPASDR